MGTEKNTLVKLQYNTTHLFYKSFRQILEAKIPFLSASLSLSLSLSLKTKTQYTYTFMYEVDMPVEKFASTYNEIYVYACVLFIYFFSSFHFLYAVPSCFTPFFNNQFSTTPNKTKQDRMKKKKKNEEKNMARLICCVYTSMHFLDFCENIF